MGEQNSCERHMSESLCQFPTNQSIAISSSLPIPIRRTYGLPQFAARIGNAYSSTNGDLVNTNLTDTDIQQNLASDEYLDDNDETKDVRAWARAGLNFTTLLDYMPPRMTDTLNQILVDMILVSVLVYSLLYTISRGFIILFLHLAYHDIVLSH